MMVTTRLLLSIPRKSVSGSSVLTGLLRRYSPRLISSASKPTVTVEVPRLSVVVIALGTRPMTTELLWPAKARACEPRTVDHCPEAVLDCPPTTVDQLPDAVLEPPPETVARVAVAMLPSPPPTLE
jgi:hypothetical protein